jgi:mannosylglucosylglycerate synthase
MPLPRRPLPRVAFIHYTSPPVIGGVEAVLASQAELLAARGFDVRVLTGRGGPLGSRVRVHRLPLLDSRHIQTMAVTQELQRGHVTPAFNALRAQLEDLLWRALRGVDVCLVHNVLVTNKHLALTAALHHLAAERGAVRLIAWCHDLSWTNPQYQRHLHPGEPWSLLSRPIGGATYVAVSRKRQQELSAVLDMSESQIELIPNGIDPSAFYHLSPVGRWLAETLRLWHQQMVLLVPVRITRRKHIEYALHVTAELVKRELSVRLLVSGPLGAHSPDNAGYLEELRALRRRLRIDDHVVFCAELPGPDGRTLLLSNRVVADLYAVSDALLLPSRDEGFGLPLLEAGLARLPAFTSDIPAFREVGGDAIETFSVGGPPAAVAQQIIHCLMDDRKYRLRRRILDHFTWDVIMRKRIVPLLTQLAPASRP